MYAVQIKRITAAYNSLCHCFDNFCLFHNIIIFYICLCGLRCGEEISETRNAKPKITLSMRYNFLDISIVNGRGWGRGASAKWLALATCRKTASENSKRNKFNENQKMCALHWNRKQWQHIENYPFADSAYTRLKATCTLYFGICNKNIYKYNIIGLSFTYSPPDYGFLRRNVVLNVCTTDII